VRIAIAGASGFIGTHLRNELKRSGHEILPLVRDAGQPGIFWNPLTGEIDTDKLHAVDAFINLAGTSVAEHWTPQRKKDIYESRIKGTQLLAATIAGMTNRPRTFLCASAIGYYGDRGAAVLTEDSGAGDTFLAHVCVDWEAACRPAISAGVRVSNLRFGIVLSTAGGAFPRMAAPFKMGAGGRLGTGKQYMSWITLPDALRAINYILVNDQLHGPFNVVAPNPVPNEIFAKVLAEVLHKSNLITVPVTMAHLAFGTEMADQVLLASDRVVPEKLSSAGFQFQYPQLRQALEEILHQRYR
jgi:uncharacterized protein